jgi:hypothetical protein
MNKLLSAATKTKTYQQLISTGLKMTSTERQLENGTLALTGKIGRGRNRATVNYTISADGNVRSNRFVARRVSNYKEGLSAVQELLSKRTA